jgi:membrane dipeptidase
MTSFLPSRRDLAVALALAAPLGLAAAQQDPAILARAKAIHERVIKLDTHVDFSPNNMSDTPPNYVTGLRTQVDLPKMKAGYNGIFFSIYTGQDSLTPSAYQRAWDADVAKFEAVHKLATKMAPDKIEIARTAADVRRIVRAGKLVALMGVENALGIGTDITRVKKMADYGARYLSLVHNGHNQLSDSNTGEANNQWLYGNGVSDLGKQVVAEANKYGILLDISHPSKGSNLWVMANSKAPVIASHSSVRALCASASRDLDDEQLQALKKNGGVMQTTAFASYINCTPAPSAQRTAALAALAAEFNIPVAAVGRGGGAGGGGGRGAAAPRSAACSIGDPPEDPAAAAGRGAGAGRGGAAGGRAGGGGRGNPMDAMDEATRTRFQTKLDAINAQHPAPVAPRRANVEDFVNHIDYAVKLIGIDYVGISSDFDGGGGVDGYNCAPEAINVTYELVKRGYNEEQIGKLWGGNLLRVMEKAEQVAKQLQGAK